MPAATLSVMTSNVRVGAADDGPDHWRHRGAALAQVLATSNADAIGLQEALAFQVDDLLAAMPAYAAIGAGREDGAQRGEQDAILYRRDRLRVLACGTFWLSETPHVPDSRSWGSAYSRMCTWARFAVRGGDVVWLANTHLDNVSAEARERGALMVRAWLAARAPAHEPAIVVGDFNSQPHEAPVRALVASRAPLIDAWRARHPTEEPSGTFTGFVPGKLDGPRIDYVLVPPTARVLRAEIVRTPRPDGRWPSDHFPVLAEVELA